MASTDQPTVREAVGFFHKADDLFEAVSELASSGFNRAEMSVLARESLLEGHMKGDYEDVHNAAEDPGTPREPVVADTDVRQMRTLAAGTAGTVGALAAAGLTILTGGAAAAAIAAAAAAGLGSAGAVEVLGRQVTEGERDLLREQIERGGILLWVRTRDREHERRATEILKRNGATEVHVHDIAT